MFASAGGSFRVTIGLSLIIAMDTVVQLVWKMGADGLPDILSLAAIEFVVRQPLFLFVGGLMACQLFVWLWVLSEADLSFAQPFFSLSRITVCLASAYFLRERVTPEQMLGIALVVIGAWCISRTRRVSAGGSKPP